MSTSSIVERSPLEASRGSLHSALRFSPFEECEKEVVTRVSSTSLGSKYKEAKVGKENEVPDPLKRCLFCKEKGHKVSQCMVLRGKNSEPAADPPLPECEMCRGEHHVVKCPGLQEYRPPLERFDEEGKIVFIKDGVTYKERPKESEYLAPHNCANCYRLHTSYCPRCPICYEEHRGYCPYYTSVEKDAAVSPYYDIICKYCEFEVDSSLKCSRCRMEVKGRVGDRLDCIVCGKPSSAVCCPYGKHIADKFRESHPQLQSEFI